MEYKLSYSGNNPVVMSEVRLKQQKKLNEDAKIAEQIRKEKERQKMKEKLERYERLGWKIFGPTCEPRQEYRTDNAKAKMDQKMAEARNKMQNFQNKKVDKVKSEETETQELEEAKDELEMERKKEALRLLNLKRHQKSEPSRENSVPIIFPKILKLRPELITAPRASTNSQKDEDTEKTKEEMDKEMEESRIKLQEKLNEAIRSITM